MRLGKFVILLAALAMAGGILVQLQPARAGICEDLWYQRNSIYHAYGYCFKSKKAKIVFGNAGCIYHSEAAIPMSYADKQTVLTIKKKEIQLGCL